jgi:UDP-N-acetylglucosamine 3-dehydrogenase
MVKIAVIGVGVMGYNHVRVLSEIEEAELIAVSDSNINRAKEIATRFRIPHYSSNHNEMLEKEDLEAVVIAVPSKFHKPIFLDCMRHNVDIFVEKPIADTLMSADEMIDSLNSKSIVFTVGHIERFNPVVMKIKELIDSNYAGEIYLVDTIRSGPFPKRLFDVGVLIDLAVHDVDIINYLIGRMKQVYSNLIFSDKREVYAKVLFKISDTIKGSSEFSWVSPKRIREIKIHGTKGTIVGDYTNQEVWFYENADFIEGSFIDYQSMVIGGSISEGKVIKFPISKSEPLKNELKHFIDCVKTKKKPLITAEEAREALKIATLIFKSGKEEKIIRVDEK